MTAQATRTTGHPISRRSEKMQDLLLVSSFGLRAGMLGVAPVLAFRVLMGS